MRFFLLFLTIFGMSSWTCLSAFINEQLDLRIPVVDMKDYYDEKERSAFLDTLYQAMTTVGFFAVRNSGVDATVIQRAYAQAEEFFQRDVDEKLLSFDPGCNGQRGFVPSEVAKGNTQKDKKEFYHIAREGSLLENIWPTQPGFKEAFTLLYEELEKYTIPLQRAIVETINQRSFPPVHLDFLNEMTKDGQWLNVVVPEDAFIVNVGDMLENLSNGLFVSARHRVLAQETNQDRFSVVLFVHPYDRAPLDPLAACIELTGGEQVYAPGTREEFLWERLLELNIAPMLLEPYSKTGHVERQMQYHHASPQVVDLLVQSKLASPELLNALEK